MALPAAPAAQPQPAESVGGAGPPNLVGMGLVWYDLSTIGPQMLVTPAEAMLLHSTGGVVGEVQIALALCSALTASTTNVVSSCTNHSAAPHAVALLHTISSDGTCIAASLGSRETVVKSLADPAFPDRGVQLEYSGGDTCQEPDDTLGDGHYHTTVILLCAPEAMQPQHVGWKRSGCTWLFTLRAQSACALAHPPTQSQLDSECATGCLGNWVGDGVCDRPCNTSSCHYDGGDCSSRTGTSSASAADSGSIMERWICEVHASMHRHGYGGGGGGSGNCVLDTSTAIGAALHRVDSSNLVWILATTAVLVVCLMATLALVCWRVCALQRTSAHHKQLIRRYRAEARLADTDEIEGLRDYEQAYH